MASSRFFIQMEMEAMLDFGWEHGAPSGLGRSRPSEKRERDEEELTSLLKLSRGMDGEAIDRALYSLSLIVYFISSSDSG